MVASALVLCAAALCSAVVPVSSSSGPAERFFLACKGTMRVAGNAQPSPVITEGVVDLARGSVHGFGTGGRERIVLLTATQIGFSTDAGNNPAQTVDGTINRVTGATAINVRRTGDPGRFLIAMELDCQFGPPPVF